MLDNLKNKMNSKEFKDAVGEGFTDFKHNLEELDLIEYQLSLGYMIKKKRIDNVLIYLLNTSTKLMASESIVPSFKRDLRLVYTTINNSIEKIRLDLNNKEKYDFDGEAYKKIGIPVYHNDI